MAMGSSPLALTSRIRRPLRAPTPPALPTRCCCPATARRAWRGSASAAAAGSASLAVVPQGTLTVRTAGVSLAIATETEKCDAIRFDAEGSLDPEGLRLDARGELAAELLAAAAEPGATPRPRLRGLIPAKYNVDVESRGGDVQMGFLEGAATIDSGGGDIALDKVTSLEILLTSSGGDIAARVLQGIVQIDAASPAPGAPTAAHGAVKVQRLVSPTVGISAGEVDCAALYADSYAIRTHGADVRLGSSHGRESSTIDSVGGDVAIGSLEGDGPLRVETGGGSAVIKLSRQTAEVAVLSSGGDVTVKASADLCLRLELEGAGGVHIDAAHRFTPVRTQRRSFASCASRKPQPTATDVRCATGRP